MDLRIVRRIWSLTLRPHKWGFLGLCTLQIVYVPLTLIQPIPLRILADNVVGEEPFPDFLTRILPTDTAPWQSALYVLVGATLLITVTTQIHNVIAWMAATKLEQKAAFELRTKLFDHVQSVPVNHLEERGTSDALFRISQDAESAKELTVGLTRYLVSLISIMGFALVMFTIDPLMSLVALIPAPIAFFLLATIRGRIRRNWDASFTSSNRAFNELSETLSLSRLIRAFSRGSRHSSVYRSLSRDTIHRTVVASRAEAMLDAALGLVFSIGQAALLVMGVFSIRRGEMTLGELLVFHAYSGQMYAPLATLSRMTGDIQQHLAMASRALTLFDLPTERSSPTPTSRTGRAFGLLEFRGVSYAYPSKPHHLVLRDLSLTIPAGSMIGITGPSGSGKSTLLDLALGFADPTSGTILLDGLDLGETDPADLRSQVALVTQDPVLFSAPIAENVRYGRPDASDADVLRALEDAGALDFVIDLPDGIDTTVGDRGAALSGGQRQRVAIARALLRDAPILIMDEPTSALDSATEAAVLSAIDVARRGNTQRTIIVVTHSEALLRMCDAVVRLEHGTQVEPAVRLPENSLTKD